jgi:hypothetical protein
MARFGEELRSFQRLAQLSGFLALLMATVPAAAEKRVALIIGNSSYRNVTPWTIQAKMLS